MPESTTCLPIYDCQTHHWFSVTSISKQRPRYPVLCRPPKHTSVTSISTAHEPSDSALQLPLSTQYLKYITL